MANNMRMNNLIPSKPMRSSSDDIGMFYCKYPREIDDFIREEVPDATRAFGIMRYRNFFLSTEEPNCWIVGDSQVWKIERIVQRSDGDFCIIGLFNRMVPAYRINVSGKTVTSSTAGIVKLVGEHPQQFQVVELEQIISKCMVVSFTSNRKIAYVLIT